MITREELEELDWVYELHSSGHHERVGVAITTNGEGYVVAVMDPETSGAAARLMAAAPELALACLEARAFALAVRTFFDWPGAQLRLTAAHAAAELKQKTDDIIRAQLRLTAAHAAAELKQKTDDIIRALDAALVLAGVAGELQAAGFRKVTP